MQRMGEPYPMVFGGGEVRMPLEHHGMVPQPFIAHGIPAPGFPGDPRMMGVGMGVPQHAVEQPRPIKKMRKPYTRTAQTRETWTNWEHERFVEGLKLYKRDWKKIEAHVGNRTVLQIRSHAQKYFNKLAKEHQEEFIPPPRTKQKPKAARECPPAETMMVRPSIYKPQSMMHVPYCGMGSAIPMQIPCGHPPCHGHMNPYLYQAAPHGKGPQHMHSVYPPHVHQAQMMQPVQAPYLVHYSGMPHMEAEPDASSLGEIPYPSYCSNYMPRGHPPFPAESFTYQGTDSTMKRTGTTISNPMESCNAERECATESDGNYDAKRRRAHRMKVLQRSRMRYGRESNSGCQYAHTMNQDVNGRRSRPREDSQRRNRGHDDEDAEGGGSNGGEENGNSGSNSDMGGSGMDTNAGSGMETNIGTQENAARNRSSSPTNTWNEADDPSSSFGSRAVSPAEPNTSAGSPLNKSSTAKDENKEQEVPLPETELPSAKAEKVSGPKKESSGRKEHHGHHAHHGHHTHRHRRSSNA